MNAHDDDIDTGAPIQELADLAEEPPGGFVDRLENTIERRTTALQFINFVWFLPANYMVEMMDLVYGLIGNPGGKGRGKR
ncbi:hypothetical protein ABI59_01225 [Acidobacteria bacterium Mor1]|nr:hypothetical protein ABI59_01225 [Acidobacteria bacterium Mor1]